MIFIGVDWSFLGDFAVAVVPIDFSETYKADQVGGFLVAVRTCWEWVFVSSRNGLILPCERLSWSSVLCCWETTGTVCASSITNFFVFIWFTLFRSCLRPLKPHPQNNTSTDVSDLIDLEQFLSQRPVGERPFYSSFFDTQIFTSFVEQRSFSHSESTSLTFFDECTEKVTLVRNKHCSMFASVCVSMTTKLPSGCRKPECSSPEGRDGCQVRVVIARGGRGSESFWVIHLCTTRLESSTYQH